MGDSILIVGGDAGTETFLRTRGLHVLSAIDAAAACDILSCEGVAVVVLDLTFPDTKGFEILRRLRGRFETRVLPAQPRVVVLADWTESAIERLAVGLGADVFLRKPVALPELLGAMDLVVPTSTAPLTAFAMNG